MNHDGRLLGQYIQDKSEAAFKKLLDRHLSLVYSVCLSELHDSDSASDAAQVTFMILARKARGLTRMQCLAGWLFTTARNVARAHRRELERRMRYESASAAVADEHHTPPLENPRVEHLNDALATLHPAEIDLIQLRFFEELSLAEIGRAIGISEDAARMRIARVLERLRRGFERSGVSATLTAIVTALDEHGAQAAPVGIYSSVLSAVSGGAGLGTAAVHLYERSVAIMKLTQLKLAAGVVACVILGFGTGSALLRDHTAAASADQYGPSHNAFDYFESAASVEQDQDLIDNDLGQDATDEQQQAALKANLPALGMLARGFAYPYQSPQFPRQGAPWFAQFRALARLLAFDSLMKQNAGDFGGAMAADIDAIQLGTDTEHSEPMISSLVGYACADIGRKGAFSIVNKLSPAVAMSDARRLERIDANSVSLVDMLSSEEKFSIAGRAPTNPIVSAAYKKYMNAVIAQAARPYSLRTTVAMPGSVLNYALPSDEFAAIEAKEADNRAQNAMLVTALALRAYQSANSTYPARLSDLVPRYIDKIPSEPLSDPFAVSSSLRYKPQGNTYVLYSVGPDGVDDGGKPIDAANTPGGDLQTFVLPDSKGDIVAGINP